jgi:hypothetical protein
MKLLLMIYGGANRQRMQALLESHDAGGWTEMPSVHGAGGTGRREGTRAWPGDSSLIFSVVPDERLDALCTALRAEVPRLASGEHLHFGIIPMEAFV